MAFDLVVVHMVAVEKGSMMDIKVAVTLVAAVNTAAVNTAAETPLAADHNSCQC